MIKKKNNLKNYVFVFFTACILVVSCSKDAGYYNAEIEHKTFNGNTYDYLKSKPGVFDSLLKVIDRLGYQDIIENDSITFFAPPNQSFQVALANLNNLRRQSELDPLSLSTVEATHLDTMLSQYITNGIYDTQSLSLQDGLNLFGVKYDYPMNAKLGTTASSGYIDGGAENIVFQNTNRSYLVSNWVSTTTSSNNIKTSNGLVHVISSDHIFGFRQFMRRFTYVPPPPNLFITIGGILTVSHCVTSQCDPNSLEGYGRLIDRDVQTKFLQGGFVNQSFQFELNEPAVAGAYTLISANDFEARDPQSWIVEGSDNGTTWYPLDERTNEVFKERLMERVFYFANKNSYKYYRITMNSMRNGNVLQLAEWTMNEPAKK